MSQFQKLSQVLAAAAVAMDKCKEAGVEFAFRVIINFEYYPSSDIAEFNSRNPQAIRIPIGICEGQKVFIGDELWHPNFGKVKVTGGDWRYLGIFSESGTDCTRSCNEFSWQESKKTINVNGKELLSCPFCGAQPESEPWHGGSSTKMLVACVNEDCWVSPAVTGETKLEANKRWNTRNGSEP